MNGWLAMNFVPATDRNPVTIAVAAAASVRDSFTSILPPYEQPSVRIYPPRHLLSGLQNQQYLLGKYR